MTKPKLRRQVLERDNYTCQNCDSGKCKLDTHHLIPESKGGKSILENMITFCHQCHMILESINHPPIPKSKTLIMSDLVKTIKITEEAHKMLIDVRRETFSEVIMKLGQHYKKCPKE